MKGSKEPERAAIGHYFKKKKIRGVDEKGGTTLYTDLKKIISSFR